MHGLDIIIERNIKACARADAHANSDAHLSGQRIFLTPVFLSEPLSAIESDRIYVDAWARVFEEER